MQQLQQAKWPAFGHLSFLLVSFTLEVSHICTSLLHFQRFSLIIIKPNQF